MYSKRIPVRTGIVVGIASALVAGLIGVAQAAGDGSVETALPAVIAEAPQPIDADPPSRTVVEVAARSGTVVEAAVGADRALAVVNASEPARRLREGPPVVFDRLVVVGDSLAEATEPVIRYATPGKMFVRKFFGGTAPCDWLDDDLEATPTTVVVITFTGNNLTPCMLDGAGARLIDEPLVEKYRADVGVLIEHARASGAWVVLVGQPLRHPSFDADLEVEGINAVYRQYATTMSEVSYVDAGQFVETPDGAYTDRLPCAEFDTDCAPDGTTVVRGDGVHFCPIVEVSPCPVWSSGAVRFGFGIASAANDPQRFD
jgi:hypothetical protein